MRIEADVQDNMRIGICERHRRVAYTVSTAALFRRLPILSKYLSSWLVDEDELIAPLPLGEVDSRHADTHPSLCLAHTYDPSARGWIGYSIRYCSDSEDYDAWIEELYVAVEHMAIGSPLGLVKSAHILSHTDTVLLVRPLKSAVARNFPPLGGPLV
jgi:hypothetical protein